MDHFPSDAVKMIVSGFEAQTQLAAGLDGTDGSTYGELRDRVVQAQQKIDDLRRQGYLQRSAA